MNKRQYKKYIKKVTYPLVDEMNLLTLSPEEYKKAIEDYKAWVYKYCRYRHYRDKYKKIGIAIYHFPVGEKYKESFEHMLKLVRRYKIETKIVFQNIQQVKASYENIDKSN